MDDGEHGDLVEAIYGMALEPELWPGLLDRLAAVMGGASGVIMQENLDSGIGGGVLRGLPDEAAGLYFNYYGARNVLRRVGNPHELMRRFTPVVTIDQETLPKNDLMRTEFYADFLRPMGIHSLLTFGLWGEGVSVTTLDVYRPANRPSFTEAEQGFANTLHPHLIRAFRLSRQLADALMVKEGLAAAVDRAPYGFFVLGPDRRLRHVNATGQQMLAQAGGLRLIAGRLATGSTAETARLEALIGAACGPAGARVGGSMAIRRPDGRSPLSLTVAPARTDRMALFNTGPTAVVCVSDPEAAVDVSELQLREVFGLTGAQAKVAIALFEGRTAREAADALGLSFFTVRAHLARIFEKTGVNRQAELVALMTRMMGPTPG